MVCSPICSRILLVILKSEIKAIRRISAPHLLQRRGSTSKIRRMSLAQVEFGFPPAVPFPVLALMDLGVGPGDHLA